MKILALETSCDETAASIVENGQKVLSNVIASQIEIHAKTGGVVPEVAAREHVLHVLPVLDECLKEAGCEWEDIDALAVTKGPGLVSSLIIGTETASTISHVKNLPLIPVHHIAGHLYSSWLGIEEKPQFPILILTVSGGHNELVLMRGHNDFEVLGETRDDAAGEAFDKVARMIGLGYPGGPEIAKHAEKGDAGAYDFPRVMLEKESLDFSFSGLKTAVLNEVKMFAKAEGIAEEKDLPDSFRADLAASFQEAVVDTLVAKLFRALEMNEGIREIHLVGGVSANKRLREKIEEMKPENLIFRAPVDMRYCTDNAAMIAAAAYFLDLSRESAEFSAPMNVVPSSSWELK